MSTSPLPKADVEFLREAAEYLENPSYLTKLANVVGVPLEFVTDKLVPAKVAELGNKALQRAMSLATDTILTPAGTGDFDQAYGKSGWTGFWHRVAASVTGGVGGAFGLPGLAVELPVTTGIMFRSIASIAGDFGEDLRDPAVRLECLTVFSHGGPGAGDDAMESTYITARLAMAKLVRDAADFVAARGARSVADAVAKGAAPALFALVNRVAAQFNVVVSQKVIAQSLPLIGIATGAAINNAFSGHFNSVAKYHFGIRRLEREHGGELVHAEYRRQLEAARRGVLAAKSSS